MELIQWLSQWKLVLTSNQLARNMRTVLLALAATLAAGASAPRFVRIKGQEFVSTATGAPVVLSGPNVVVKASPYLPAVSGTTHCHDMINATCSAAGTCTSCETFNEADVALLKSQGRNMIRLSVVWAGAQPRDEDKLDPAFLARLHALLNLTDKSGINVILDNHGDMVGTAGCGNGVPMWFQQKAPGVAALIGKPLTTDLPFSLIPNLVVSKTGGYDHCGSNATMWAAHAGDPNYNMLNECCLAMNSGGNPAGLGWTSISQKTMDYMVGYDGLHQSKDMAGRASFVRYWKLLAEAVVDHPSAVGCELMNEPMSINRRGMYETWQASAEAILAIIPDMSIAVCDTGEGAVLPGWIYSRWVDLPYLTPSHATVMWMKASSNLFYAWHYYGNPKTPADAVTNALAVQKVRLRCSGSAVAASFYIEKVSRVY